MHYSKVHQVHFSGGGTTRRVVQEISNYFPGTGQVYDALEKALPKGLEFGPDELLIVGMPVYSGRIPELGAQRLARLKGNSTPAIIAVTFGNREYDDALLELKNVMEANGFRIISAAACVTEHSIFHKVGKGRPDKDDLAKIAAFSQKSAAKLAGLSAEAVDSLSVKGNFPYRQINSVPLKPSGGRGCDKCGACVKVCSYGAIDPEHPKRTNKKRCVNCGACISACPQKVRNYHGILHILAGRGFAKKCSARKEPEFFM